MRHRDGLHAFLHHADVLEDAGDLPAHPAGDVRHLPRERQRGRDDAGADLAVHPEPDADRRGRDQQRRVHHREREVELRDEPHVPAHRLLVLIHAFPDIRIFISEAGEELDRKNVRVAVDHARHHDRAHFRARARQVAHLRHEVPQEREIPGEPHRYRQTEPPVRQRHQAPGAHAIDADVEHRADARHGALAQRVRRGHHAVGDAAGEIVLEERPALPDHVPVALPADERGRARYERVVPDRDVDQQHQRPHDEHQRHHADEQRPLALERRHAIGRFHQRHEAPDEERNHRIEQRHRQARREHRREPAFGLLDEMPIELEQPGRRRAGRGARGPVNTTLE